MSSAERVVESVMKLTVATRIDAPIDRVFALITDVERWPDFIAAIESVKMLEGVPGEVGAKFRETRRMYGQVTHEDMTFAEIDAPNTLVTTAFSHGTRYRVVHDLKRDGIATVLTLTFSGQPESWLARLMTPIAWLFTNSLHKQLSADLNDLKRAVEAQDSP